MRKAAVIDTTADNSLGNVIAANSISVFLGSCGIMRVLIFYIYFLYIRTGAAVAGGLHLLGDQ